jgi:hypothetical protein
MMSNWLKHDTQMVYEGYAQYSADNGDLGNEINSTGTFGALAYARWFDHRVFYDVGWGINYSTDTTRDLPSSINSTPVFGVGLREKRVDKELLYGIRFLHISNANQRSRNPGSNQLLIYVQVRSF